MSQGDATYNATTDIRILLRELELSRERWTGYTDKDMHIIIRAIGYVRASADREEQESGLLAAAHDAMREGSKETPYTAWGGPYNSDRQPTYFNPRAEKFYGPPVTAGKGN